MTPEKTDREAPVSPKGGGPEVASKKSPGDTSATEVPKPALAGRPIVAKLMLWLGVWGTLAAYISTLAGYQVNVAPLIEVVDHVVPGLVILVVAGLFLRTGRRPLVPALAAVLASFWMLSTHIPLVRDAANHFQSAIAAAIHALPAAILLLLSLMTAVHAYRETPD